MRLCLALWRRVGRLSAGQEDQKGGMRNGKMVAGCDEVMIVII